MAKTSAPSDIDLSSNIDEGATRSDAVTNIRFLEDTFSYYAVDVHECVLCTISGNASVNRVLPNLSEFPIAGCLSHELNIEVRLLMNEKKNLRALIESIHSTMSNWIRILRNRAMLWHLTSPGTVLHNATRWSSEYSMLKRFDKIRNLLMQVADTESATVTLDRSEEFQSISFKSEKQLQVVNKATLIIQKKGISLSDCLHVVDDLIASIESNKHNQNFVLHKCTLGTKYIDEIFFLYART